MKVEDLREEVSVELELMEVTVEELLSLLRDVGGREPSVREKTAAAAFMAQFYNGIKNLLKRISRFHSVPLPTGDTWHVDLFRRFCDPPRDPMPCLFNKALELQLSAYRRFRHVVYHGYGLQLDWARMIDGLQTIQSVFSVFRERLLAYLRTLEALSSEG